MIENMLDKSNVDDIFEINGTQHGMLFHYLRENEDHMYNVQISINIDGDIDVDLLEEAFRLTRQNNESLRSVFRWEKLSKPLQIVLKNYPVKISYHDLSTDETLSEKDLVESDRYTRFDLREVPIRLTVLKLQPGFY